MIKLFSLIFYLYPEGQEGAVTWLTPLHYPKSKAQTQFEIKNYNNELMSHLLCLNSCDNYPNKCPHICLHLLVKQLSAPLGREYSWGVTPTEGAYYTDYDNFGK